MGQPLELVLLTEDVADQEKIRGVRLSKVDNDDKLLSDPGRSLCGPYLENLEEIQRLKSYCEITAVLNLQADEDLEERRLDWPALETSYRDRGIMALRVPMRDFDYHDQKRVLPHAVKALARLLALGHTVYLHCNMGQGRSPLVAMAYLYWCRCLSLEEAIGHVEERRPCSPMTELLEVARQDLLQNEELRKRIALRA